MSDIDTIDLTASNVNIITMGLGTVDSLMEDLGDSYNEFKDGLSGAHDAVESDEEAVAYIVIKITK